MNDSYVEYLIQRKTSPIKKAWNVLLYVWTVFFLFYGLLGRPTLFILGMIFGGISYFATMGSEVEFEYLFLGKDFSVDRILGRSKRKKMHEFDIVRMEILAPAGSHRLDSYMQNKKYVTYDYASHNEAAQTYCFIYEGDSEVSKVYLDMTDELLACFRNVSPRKVFTD